METKTKEKTTDKSAIQDSLDTFKEDIQESTEELKEVFDDFSNEVQEALTEAKADSKRMRDSVVEAIKKMDKCECICCGKKFCLIILIGGTVLIGYLSYRASIC